MEIWKTIEDFPNYEVSSLGRVRGKRGLLNPYSDKRGYLYVNLRYNGTRKTPTVHRLVAIHFIDNPLNKEQVNHIDGDKTNNSTVNLEWVSNQENQDHSYEVLGRVRSDNSGKPKKAVRQYSIDGTFIAEYESAHEAARQIDGNYSRICLVCRGGGKTHKGFMWEYKEETNNG